MCCTSLLALSNKQLKLSMPWGMGFRALFQSFIYPSKKTTTMLTITAAICLETCSTKASQGLLVVSYTILKREVIQEGKGDAQQCSATVPSELDREGSYC